VKRLDPTRFTVVMREGSNRQIRRMCDALGYTIVYLRRIRVMNLRLGDLSLGKYRELSNAEIAALKK